MPSPVLGIDLGTTNSVVAAVQEGAVRVLADEEGNRLFPSVVSFHPGGDVLTGYPARERRLLDAQNTIYSIKRLIGRPYRSDEVRRATERFPFSFEEGPTGGALVVARAETYTLPEISAFVLREVRALAEDALGVACRRSVITVPANFNELQRSATKAAGRVAGLEVLRILNEPTAAALAYGCGSGRARERIAVYDLGGGTFDITLLELAEDVFEVISTAGDTFLGGDDIDISVADEMAAAFLTQHRYDVRTDAQAYERLRAAAEWAKCQLSSAPDVELRVEELAYGGGGEALDLDFHMTRERLEGLSHPLVARTFDVCEEAMRLASLRPTQLDTVILVGGGTRIPLVRRMVEQYFGREPRGSIDPDLVVAQGAAIQGAALANAEHEGPPTGKAIGRVALRRTTRASVEIPIGPAFQPDSRASSSPPRRMGPAGEGRGRTLPPPPPQLTYGGPGLPAPRASAVPPLGPPALPEPSATLSLDDLIADESEPAPPLTHADHGLQLSDADFSQPAVEAPSLPVPDIPSLEPPSGLEAPGGLPPVQPSVVASRQHGGRGTGAPPGIPSLTPPSEDDLPMPISGAPLLLDVTPHSLGVETAGGFCEVVIARNAAIPVEQSRVFSTSLDYQEEVLVRVCQGESRRLGENQLLGELALRGLRPAPRGKLRIEVTFVLDADGTLRVRATDRETGVAQSIQVLLVGGLDEAEVRRMRERQSAMVEVSS